MDLRGKLREPSGAKAQVFIGYGGTAEAAPFPKRFVG
jgi:hypothetical protein